MEKTTKQRAKQIIKECKQHKLKLAKLLKHLDFQIKECEKIIKSK